MKKILLVCLGCFFIILSQFTYAQSLLWKEVSLQQRSASQNSSEFELMPDRYSLYQLDIDAMREHLKDVTSYRSSNDGEAETLTLSVPLPSKEMIDLIITETSVMAPALAAKFPQIKTYEAVVVGRPSVVGVVGVNSDGFHGMLLMENGQRLFIDQRSNSDGDVYYISYYDRDYRPANKKRTECGVNESNLLKRSAIESSPIADNLPIGELQYRSGADIRTYRLAMAATGEYTNYHGGTVENGLSAVVTTVARINVIYQRDLAIKFELVANNDEIIFTTATNPYTANDSDTLVYSNQAIVDGKIGTANYDIGHVVTAETGGGIARQASACSSSKAEGMTGHFEPINDPFDIDYVAHEIGHQFGGQHSFNATIGGCNRNVGTNWEIGNGVTIMGYVGVCDASNNVTDPANSIAMFHIGNIREMTTFIDSSTQGGSCGTATTLTNNQPVASAGNDYTIPSGTPFKLTGTGTDADSADSLTYTWEQMDLGTEANISDGDIGNNPLFRVFLPTNVNSRSFPQLSDIVNNTTTTGELLPTTSRSMKFAFTVRDQNGGVADDEATVTVIKTTTPFKITSHTTSSTLAAGTSTSITWDVGDTASSPISCSQVDLLLSFDSGLTFATTLASKTDNDGSESVVIPTSVSSSNGYRIKVACSNNIFFDISDADLTISNTSPTNMAETSVKEFNSGISSVNYFKLAISSALSVDASVTFETRDGTGKAGEDYIAASGTATITAGQTETLIGVTILGDDISESDETFLLVITNPVNAAFPTTVTEITATHTILNDD